MKILVIFSGYNQRAIISFLRIVNKYEIPFVIVSSGSEDKIYDSLYADKVCYERKNKPLNIESFKPIINYLHCNFPSFDYIFVPSTEALNRFLLANKKYFNNSKVLIPLVDKNMYELISNKYSFRKLCDKESIKIPKEYNEIKFLPIVAKPKKYFSIKSESLYPCLILNEKDKLKFLKSKLKEEYYFEEFIKGKSFYLLYYISKNGNILSYSQKNLVQQPGGKSILAAEPATVHNEKISSKFISLIKKIGFRGLIMFEVRFDGNDYYAIEANPRLWGPSQLFIDAGIKFFENYLFDLGFNINLTIKNGPINKALKYFWFGGFINTLRKNTEPTYLEGMDKEYFLKNIELFLKDDIYKRSDTMKIYLKELI